jgi:hypothetical protein
MSSGPTSSGASERDQEMLRIFGMTHADMAVSVNDLFPRQDPIGDYKILYQCVEIAHPFHLLNLSAPAGLPS